MVWDDKRKYDGEYKFDLMDGEGVNFFIIKFIDIYLA